MAKLNITLEDLNTQNEKYKDIVQYLDGEVWKQIPDIDNYFISSYGRVWSCKQSKIMKLQTCPYKCNSQYLHIRIKVIQNGVKKYVWKKIHRLVAIAFVPNPENKREVHHKDCNIYNNHPSNLQWLDAKEHKEIHREMNKRINKNKAEKAA